MALDMGNNSQTAISPGRHWLGLLTLLSFVGVVGILGTSRYPLCACRSPVYIGKRSVGTLNQAQHAYWVEHQHFAQRIEQLETGIAPESHYYRYSTVVSPTQAILYGTPREPGYAYAREVYGFGLYSRTIIDKRLPSYVAGVFATQSGAIATILCQTDESTMKRPAPPALQAGQAVCAAGTTEVE